MTSQLPQRNIPSDDQLPEQISYEIRDPSPAPDQSEPTSRYSPEEPGGYYRINYAPPRRGGYCGIVLTICATITFVLLILAAVMAFQTANGLIEAIFDIPEKITTIFTGRARPKLPPVPMIIETLQTEGKLGILYYTTQDVVDEKREGCILGTERLLYVMQGNAAIGVNLDKLKEENIIIEEDARQILMRLPPVERLYAHIDIDESHIYAYDCPPGCGCDQFKMIQDAQINGQKLIESNINSEEMTELALKYTLDSMAQFLELLEFEEIKVVIDTLDEKDIEGITPSLSPAASGEITATVQVTPLAVTAEPTSSATDEAQPLPIETTAAEDTPQPLPTETIATDNLDAENKE